MRCAGCKEKITSKQIYCTTKNDLTYHWVCVIGPPMFWNETLDSICKEEETLP